MEYKMKPKKYGDTLYYFECLNPGLLGNFAPSYFGDSAAEFLKEHPNLKIVTMMAQVNHGSCVGYWVVVDRKRK